MRKVSNRITRVMRTDHPERTNDHSLTILQEEVMAVLSDKIEEEEEDCLRERNKMVERRQEAVVVERKLLIM